MMTIKKIIWLSEDALEAKVEVTDGMFTIICFRHPCELTEGQELVEPIQTLDASNIMRIAEEVYLIEKLSGSFSYHLTGKLIDKSRGILRVGGLIIDVGDNIPKDISQGEFIEVICDRFDIY